MQEQYIRDAIGLPLLPSSVMPSDAVSCIHWILLCFVLFCLFLVWKLSSHLEVD